MKNRGDEKEKIYSNHFDQVRIGLLQAGHYGVPQTRWRVFLMAGIPFKCTKSFIQWTCLLITITIKTAHRTTILPQFPRGLYAFRSVHPFSFSSHKIQIKNVVYNCRGGIFPYITVENAISDLPPILAQRDGNKAWGRLRVEYYTPPSHPYQRQLRAPLCVDRPHEPTLGGKNGTGDKNKIDSNSIKSDNDTLYDNSKMPLYNHWVKPMRTTSMAYGHLQVLVRKKKQKRAAWLVY